MVRSKTIHVHVAQQVEAAALNPAQCGFDSLRGHQVLLNFCVYRINNFGDTKCYVNMDVVKKPLMY